MAQPGIIKAVFSNNGVPSATVQLAITEDVTYGNKVHTGVQHPLLVDVPIYVQQGGGYLVTLPVVAGDEGLVVFGDSCMDAWWQSGGVQNQIFKRRHSLSDGYVIVGFRNKTRAISDYSTDSIQIRNEDGDTIIDLQDGTVTITAGTLIEMDCSQIALSGAWSDLKSFVTEAFQTVFNLHVHPIPTGVTGPPESTITSAHLTQKVKGL